MSDRKESLVYSQTTHSPQIPLVVKTKYTGVIFVCITIFAFILSSYLEGVEVGINCLFILTVTTTILLITSLYRWFGSKTLFRIFLLVFFTLQGIFLSTQNDHLFTTIVSFTIAISYIPSERSKLAKILTPYYKEKEKLLPSYHVKMKNIQDILQHAKKDPDIKASTIKELNLSNLGLVELCDLSPFINLRTLDLSNNKLKSFTFLKGLENLTLLKLTSNDLSSMDGLIPFVPGIKVLHLNKNNLKTIPDSIKKLVNLQALMVNDNQIEVIENLPFSLETLIISRNKISSFAPKEIMYTLTKLKKISASNNSFTTLPLHLGRSHLRELRLGNNSIADCPIAEEKEISLPVCIQILDLGNNAISSIAALKNIFTMLPLLRNLNLSCNPVCENQSYSLMCQKLCSKRLNTLDNKTFGTKYQNPSNKKK